MELLLILATYALTSGLTGSQGPLGAFARLRANKNMTVLKCFLCTSVLVGAVFALYTAENPLEWLILALALGGGATAIDRLTIGKA